MLIRDARLVALTDAVDAMVDVRAEDGVVTEVGPSLPTRSGETSYDAAGRWLMPGLWDQHVHLGQWTLASALERADPRSPRCAIGSRSGPTFR